MPADSQNIKALLEKETLRHHNISACGKRSRALLQNQTMWDHIFSDDDEATHPPGHCDFFACWGSRTEGISSISLCVFGEGVGWESLCVCAYMRVLVVVCACMCVVCRVSCVVCRVTCVVCCVCE
jgi:hypothetical protein